MSERRAGVIVATGMADIRERVQLPALVVGPYGGPGRAQPNLPSFIGKNIPGHHSLLNATGFSRFPEIESTHCVKIYGTFYEGRFAQRLRRLLRENDLSRVPTLMQIELASSSSGRWPDGEHELLGRMAGDESVFDIGDHARHCLRYAISSNAESVDGKALGSIDEIVGLILRSFATVVFWRPSA